MLHFVEDDWQKLTMEISKQNIRYTLHHRTDSTIQCDGGSVSSALDVGWLGLGPTLWVG